jgi:phosphatidylinositol glycan class F
MTKRDRNKTKARSTTPNVSNVPATAKSMGIGTNDAAPWPSSYISTVCVHATLWVFVALYFPRSISLINLENPEWDRIQVSSRDRPQHPFLEALTAHPTWTLFSICLGGTILQTWWAAWTRDWWLRLGIRGTSDEKRMERAFHDGQKFSVRDSVYRYYLNVEHLRQAFLNSCGATFASSFLIHLTLILFGAPITRFF